MQEHDDILEAIKRRRFKEGKGVTEPEPKEGARRFFFLLATHGWKLVTLNLLFLAFCIPVLTIPAALCGMNRVLIELVREGRCFLWKDFIREFKANLLKSLPFGLLYALLLWEGVILAANAVTGRLAPLLALGGGLFLLGFAAVFFGYAFVFLAALPLRAGDIAKNALILTATEWKTNLALLGCLGGIAASMAALLPYSLALLPLGAFTFARLIVCTAVNGPLQRRIIAPYECSLKAQPGGTRAQGDAIADRDSQIP